MYADIVKYDNYLLGYLQKFCSRKSGIFWLFMDSQLQESSKWLSGSIILKILDFLTSFLRETSVHKGGAFGTNMRFIAIEDIDFPLDIKCFKFLRARKPDRTLWAKKQANRPSSVFYPY